MKRPLTGLVVVYAAGIWLGSALNWPAALAGWCAAGALIAFLLSWRTRLSLLPLLVMILCLGGLAYRLRTAHSAATDITRLLPRQDQNVTLRGIIVSDTGYRVAETADTEPSDERHSFKLQLTALRLQDRWESATGRLLMFVSTNRPIESLAYGDVLECSAILRVPPPARNPGTFDWARWLSRQNIPFTATIRKTDDCRVLAVGHGNPVMALSLRLRAHIERALRVGLEDEPRLAGVLAGMVIGERSEIPPETYADFQETGVFHVFAISGLHVGLVTVVVLGVLRLFRIPRRWCGAVAIPVLMLYVFASGARPGAVRALVMAVVWLIGWMLVRPTDALSNLAAAAAVLLVWEPLELFDGGFLLSFTVVLALVMLFPRIEAWLLALLAPDRLLPRQFVPHWRTWMDPPVRWLVRLVSCSVAAWVGLVPLMAWYFHLFTPVSIVANVLVVPMLGFIIALGMGAAVAQAFWPWLTLTFNNANFFLLSAMMRGIERLDAVPFGHQFVQAPPWWIVVGYYALLVLLLNRSISRKYKLLAGAVGVAVAVGTLAWPRRGVELTVLDLSDGVSVFVNLPGEHDDWLIDGGGDWSGDRVVVPFLRAQGVDRLNTIALTRGDKAHAAGLTVVARHIPVTRALHSATGSRSKYFWNWLEGLRQLRIPIATMRAGDEEMAGSVLRVRALNPPAATIWNRSDDNALVLLVEYGATRVLLMSDAGETVERSLLARGADVRAHIIIKGRHSNEPSCTDAFLDAVAPALVVQSVGTRPSDRYLQPELRERLQQRGIRFYRSDETGAVTLRLQPAGYTVQTCLAPVSSLGKEP